MNTKLKNILLVAAAAAVIFGFALYGLVKAPEQYSMTERRALAQLPKITSEQLLSGKFMTEFEDYTLDQFPMRDWFRTIKAFSSKYIFLKKDNNGLYSVDGYISKLEYPMSEVRVDKSVDKLNEVYDKFIAGTDCKAYLSIIPDKNYFFAPLGGYLSMDYSAFVQKVRDDMDYASYIDIFDKLELSDFYKTDQHWRQEAIVDVAQTVAEKMGADITFEFKDNVVDEPFYGAYCGQIALDFPPDTIHYLTNDVLDNCIVKSYNTGKPAESHMYDMEAASGKDPYEMFLSGSDPLITIENPKAKTDKELVVFRDSFGSSLIPLLAEGYAKITVVDLRYIRSDILGNFIEFGNQDVLFMYSTLVMNNTLSM